jgi:hypothetical protein
MERGKVQEEILNELSENIRTYEDVDWEKAGELVNYYLTELI